ncbi:unnamed protein product, partial [marine sediment metagenome]
GVVTGGATHIRAEWNFRAVLIALVAAWFLQSIVSTCLFYSGTVKLQIAMLIATAVDAMVLIRLVIARIRRERGRGWIFYAILPFLIIPVIELSVHLWSPH